MATVLAQLGAVSVTGNGTLTSIYRAPTGKTADVNVFIANSADTDTQLKVAIIKNDVVGNVAAEDYIMGGTSAGLPTSTLVHNMAPIQITGIGLTAGDTVAVSSSASAVAVQVNGLEQDA